MSYVGTLVRFAMPVVVLVLTGCVEPTGTDLVAPGSGASPATSCATRAASGRFSATCAPISWHIAPEQSKVSHG